MVLGAAATLLATGGASAQAGSPSAQPDVDIDALPAVPIPAAPSLGKGKDRALVLGGGGEYFIAWLLGFARGLRSAGVSYDIADVIVGTSAGAIVGSAAAADHAGYCATTSIFSAVSQAPGRFDTDPRIELQSGPRAQPR